MTSVTALPETINPSSRDRDERRDSVRSKMSRAARAYISDARYFVAPYVSLVAGFTRTSVRHCSPQELSPGILNIVIARMRCMIGGRQGGL